MDRRRHWPRAVMALVVVAGSAAIGVTTLLAGPALADVPPCGTVVPGVLGPCPAPAGGSATGAPSDTGGAAAIKTTWTGVPTGGHISSIKGTVTWITTGTPAGPTPDTNPVPFTANCPPGGDRSSCDVAWPVALASRGYVLNGQYAVTATAVTCPDDTGNSLLTCSSFGDSPNVSGTFAVKNQPTPPGNVTAKLVTVPVPGVALTWDPSPEPDVFAYEVIRLSGTQPTVAYGCAQAWAPKEFAGLPRCGDTLSWTDLLSGGGRFSYQVLATRFGATYAAVDQVHSAPAQTKAAITVPGPATPTVGAGKVATFGGLGAVFNPVKPRAGAVAPVFGKVGPNPNAPGTTDSGFNPTLPYNAPQPAVTDPPSTVAAAAPAAPKSNGSVASIALIGAGVLVIVVALHGLWLRGEVRRSGALEALEPEL